MVCFGLSRKELTYCVYKVWYKGHCWGLGWCVALWFHNNCLLMILYRRFSHDRFSHAMFIVQAARTSWHAVCASSLDTDTVEQLICFTSWKMYFKSTGLVVYTQLLWYSHKTDWAWQSNVNALNASFVVFYCVAFEKQPSVLYDIACERVVRW